MTPPLVDAQKTAVVTIDMHRGHLDPAVATMPLPARSRRARHRGQQGAGRRRPARGVPVIHVVTSYHDVRGDRVQPVVAASRGYRCHPRQCAATTSCREAPGCEVMPDCSIRPTRGLQARNATTRSWRPNSTRVLRARGIDTLLLTGVNTNSCVLATTVSANARDYAPVVVEDCVDTMDRSVHEPALAIYQAGLRLDRNGGEILEAL